MSMYGKFPRVMFNGKLVEQNGLDGAPKAWPTTDCSKDVRLTVQAPREEVDINRIVKKMEKGQLVGVNGVVGRFEDLSQFDGLADAIVKVQKAKDEFMSLPADLRSRFDNDPVKLVEFLEDGNNRKEAIELGLVVDLPSGGGVETVPPTPPEDKK